MSQFAAEDVRKIAVALTRTAIETVSEEDGGARNQCKLCQASVSWEHKGEDIVHQPDCAVAIGQRLLAKLQPYGV